MKTTRKLVGNCPHEPKTNKTKNLIKPEDAQTVFKKTANQLLYQRSNSIVVSANKNDSKQRIYTTMDYITKAGKVYKDYRNNPLEVYKDYSDKLYMATGITSTNREIIVLDVDSEDPDRAQLTVNNMRAAGIRPSYCIINPVNNHFQIGIFIETGITIPDYYDSTLRDIYVPFKSFFTQSQIRQLAPYIPILKEEGALERINPRRIWDSWQTGFHEERKKKYSVYFKDKYFDILGTVEDKNIWCVNLHKFYLFVTRCLNYSFDGDLGFTGYNCQNPFHSRSEVFNENVISFSDIAVQIITHAERICPFKQKRNSTSSPRRKMLPCFKRDLSKYDLSIDKHIYLLVSDSYAFQQQYGEPSLDKALEYVSIQYKKYPEDFSGYTPVDMFQHITSAFYHIRDHFDPSKMAYTIQQRALSLAVRQIKAMLKIYVCHNNSYLKAASLYKELSSLLFNKENTLSKSSYYRYRFFSLSENEIDSLFQYFISNKHIEYKRAMIMVATLWHLRYYKNIDIVDIFLKAKSYETELFQNIYNSIAIKTIPIIIANSVQNNSYILNKTDKKVFSYIYNLNNSERINNLKKNNILKNNLKKKESFDTKSYLFLLLFIITNGTRTGPPP